MARHTIAVWENINHKEVRVWEFNNHYIPKCIVPHHQPLTPCAFILHHPIILLLAMNTITTNASLEAASQTIKTVLQTDVVAGGDRWNNAVHRISKVMVSIANILLQYYSTHIFQTHIHSVIPHATAILQLLIVVDVVWPQVSTQ